jgi:hypothetical protein
VDLVNPSQLIGGKMGFLATLLGKRVHFPGNLDLCGLLRRGKLPLPRGEEIFILPPMIAGVFGLQGY